MTVTCTVWRLLCDGYSVTVTLWRLHVSCNGYCVTVTVWRLLCGGYMYYMVGGYCLAVAVWRVRAVARDRAFTGRKLLLQYMLCY